MHVQVTCAGVVIGTAQFDLPRGLAVASLWPTPDYAAVSGAAREIGRELAETWYHPSHEGDFAGVVAARWSGGRLALEDMSGRELAIDNIVVIEGLPVAAGGTAVQVVADFRSDIATASYAAISSFADRATRSRRAM